MSSTNVFGRLRSSSKIGPDYDQEGHLVEVETREDELQQQRLTEIINLLVAAGYFRARIKGICHSLTFFVFSKLEFLVNIPVLHLQAPCVYFSNYLQ